MKYLIILLLFASCKATAPGYTKYKEYKKDRIQCPANQLIKEKKKKMAFYRLTHLKRVN